MRQARAFFFVCAGIFLLVLAYHSGAIRSEAANVVAPAPTEVAVMSGVLANGQTIPLPTYADGTVATEANCQWLISPNTFLVQYSGYVTCYTQGRIVHLVSQGGQNDPNTVVNYLIIATRGVSQPTPAQGKVGQATGDR